MTQISNIDFFKNLNKSIDPHAEEVTICRGIIEENLYDVNSIPVEYISRFIDELGQRFQLGLELKKLQQFSFQAADGIHYFEDKLMAVYSGGKEDFKKYDIKLFDPHDDYCINFFLSSKKTVVKFYDLAINNYKLPTLPEGSVLAYPFGHGVGTSGPNQDVYFCNSDLDQVTQFFNLPKPSVAEINKYDSDPSINKIFGLTFNSNNLKLLKLKRYFYPKDPESKFILYDEVE